MVDISADLMKVDVMPRGTASAYLAAPLDHGKEALENVGYRIISLQENARLRIQEGKDAFISRNGNWVREGVLYVPNKGAYLTKHSPIMANPKEATDCHRSGNEFYLTDAQVEQGSANSVKFVGTAIPTDKFADNEITVFAFGDDAKKYGDFLMEAGIREMPLYRASQQDKAFARQMWFGGLGGRSGLDGRDLDYGGGRVRGYRIVPKAQ